MMLTGCESTYSVNNPRISQVKLDPQKAVMVSTPPNGRYQSAEYQNSGMMTANAIAYAFKKHASKVEVASDCHGNNCWVELNPAKYGYYVMPGIMHWEERATEWSGRPDQITIEIKVYDTTTKEEVSSIIFSGKSKWATFGGDHPQDLLPEPIDEYVNSLY